VVVSAGVLMRRRGRRGARVEGELALGVLWALWRWRLELALLALAFGTQRVLARVAGDAGAVITVVLVVLVALAVASSRRLLLLRLYGARVRREWDRAVLDSGLAANPFSGPRVVSAARVAAGDRLRLRVRRGGSVGELEARGEELAACLRAREVRVMREASDAAQAAVLVVRRDPFEGASPLAWPQAWVEELSLWDPVALGVDEQGDRVSVLLPERNVLLGGEPGAGKSAALSLLVAAAALDSRARLWLLDGKLVELAAWAPVAQRVVGTDGREAIALLREVQAEMDGRYRELLARGLRKVGREDDLPLHLVVCDELAFYLSLPDRRERQAFIELLRDLVARGRAAGVIVCAATQKPGSDVVPTALRDLFGFRLALRCNTPQASDTILGQGWASAGADASTIPGGQRGVGYLLTEGDRAVRVKGFYLGDDDVRAIAERGAARRADAWLATTSGAQSEDAAAGAG
jgi:FtsK/SpoIIIE family